MSTKRRGATRIVQVARLHADVGRRLTGPGIATECRLTAEGLPEAAWRVLGAVPGRFPRGVEVNIGDKTFTLGPTPSWSDGAAACVATLENWDSYSNRGRTTALASTPFDVQP